MYSMAATFQEPSGTSAGFTRLVSGSFAPQEPQYTYPLSAAYSFPHPGQTKAAAGSGFFVPHQRQYASSFSMPQFGQFQVSAATASSATHPGRYRITSSRMAMISRSFFMGCTFFLSLLPGQEKT